MTIKKLRMKLTSSVKFRDQNITFFNNISHKKLYLKSVLKKGKRLGQKKKKEGKKKYPT